MKNEFCEKNLKKINNISFNNLDFLDKIIYSEKELLVISNILLKEKVRLSQ